MEFGDITKAADKVKSVTREERLKDEKIADAVEDFYGDLLARLSQENIVRPQALPESVLPHIVMTFSNQNYDVILDFDSFIPEPSDQKIAFIVKNKKAHIRKRIDVFRPQSKKGYRITVDRNSENTGSSVRELQSVLGKTKPDPKPKFTFSKGAKPRA